VGSLKLFVKGPKGGNQTQATSCHQLNQQEMDLKNGRSSMNLMNIPSKRTINQICQYSESNDSNKRLMSALRDFLWCKCAKRVKGLNERTERCAFKVQEGIELQRHQMVELCESLEWVAGRTRKLELSDPRGKGYKSPARRTMVGGP